MKHKSLTIESQGIHGNWQPPGLLRVELYPAKRKADAHHMAWRQLCRREFQRWRNTPMLTDIRWWEMTGCGWDATDETIVTGDGQTTRDWFFALPGTGRRGLYEDSGSMERGVRRMRLRLWRHWKRELHAAQGVTKSFLYSGRC